MSLEIALITPVLMVIVLLVVQFGLALHAQHIAQSAASRALAAARVDGGTAADGQARAKDVLAALGDQILKDPHVTVTRNGQRVHVHISGVAITVVPGAHIPVSADADGNVDQFTPDTGPPAAGARP